jgi:hypothetical protein
MTGPPFRDRGKSLTLAQRVAQVHIRESHHPHRGRLDDRDRAAARVDHNLAQPRDRQRIVRVLVLRDQPGRRGLSPAKIAATS